jgi:hypothetical protein
MVDKFKWTLRAFEGLSGLKINFYKSKLVVYIDSASAHNFAAQLHYKLDSLSLKYLDLSFHGKQPAHADW